MTREDIIEYLYSIDCDANSSIEDIAEELTRSQKVDSHITVASSAGGTDEIDEIEFVQYTGYKSLVEI